MGSPAHRPKYHKNQRSTVALEMRSRCPSRRRLMPSKCFWQTLRRKSSVARKRGWMAQRYTC